MTELAVIGMDAKFSGQDNIDRVERAFYLGANVGNSIGTSGMNTAEEPQSISATVLTSVALLAETNQLNMANIAVLIIADVNNCADDQLVQQVAQQCASCVVITDLGQALKQATDLVNNQDCAVAVIGINSASAVGHDCVKVDSANSDSVNSDTAEAPVATISFDETFSGYASVAGFASLLISSTDFAGVNQCYIYACIKGFAQLAVNSQLSSENTELNVENIANTVSLALQQAQITTQQVGLLEVTADSKAGVALSESQGLMSAYSHTQTLHTALSCARSVTGEDRYFSQVAGLLKAVISLHQRYIPAIKDWQQPIQTQMSEWQRSPFYMPVDARPWFPNADGSAHVAAYSCVTRPLLSNNALSESALEYGYCHVILQENKVKIAGQVHPVSDVRSNGFCIERFSSGYCSR